MSAIHWSEHSKREEERKQREKDHDEYWGTTEDSVKHDAILATWKAESKAIKKGKADRSRIIVFAAIVVISAIAMYISHVYAN